MNVRTMDALGWASLGILLTGCFSPANPTDDETNGSSSSDREELGTTSSTSLTSLTSSTSSGGEELGTIDEGPSSESVSSSTGAMAEDASTTTVEGTTIDQSEESGVEGGEDEDTASQAPCTDDPDCMDPTPFCHVDSGACVDCSGLPDGDAACEAAEPNSPLCFEGTCVACTGENLGACENVCDVETNRCTECTEHEQCPGPAAACHKAPGARQGTCFPAGAVLNAGPGQEFSSITAALDTLRTGDAAVVLLHGTRDIDEVVTLIGNRVVLFRLAPNADLRWVSIDAPGGDPLTISQGATAYLHGIRISEGGGVGVAVQHSTLWVEDSHITNHSSTGISASGSTLLVKNSSITTNGLFGISAADGALRIEASHISASLACIDIVNDGTLEVENSHISSCISGIQASSESGRGTLNIANTRIDNCQFAVVADSVIMTMNNSSLIGSSTACSFHGETSAEIVYSTLAGVSCEDTTITALRNSIVVRQSGSPALDCSGAIVLDSYIADDASSPPFNADWFADYDAGDFSLTSDHPFAGVAVWREGDPTTDIDGTPRPTEDGAPDVAGAHIP